MPFGLLLDLWECHKQYNGLAKPNRLVHLLTVNGKDSGALFAYKKNMKSIERIVDTRSLVTRLYAVGADGLTFADINSGKPYLEDFTYSKEIRITTLDCSSFTNPYQMKEFTAMRLAEYCKPTVSYVLNAMDLSVLTGYEHEAWNLGDYVRVEDKELGISVTTRIVRREYNLQEPWNTVLELSTTLKNLGSSVSTLDTIADSLEGTSVVSNNDIRELVPFNHLRNSRADDDMAYWVNSGFEADGENGASGTASFKAVGVAGMTKSMSQTVYPSSRSSYTLSAQIASEDLEKLSDDAQVGIEVVIEYEDGTIYTRKGCPWVDSNVKVILTNITYTGNMLFHKEYCLDPITKKRKKNRGELPQYFVEDTHEAIIPMEEWQAVQAEFKRRRDLGVFGNKSLNLNCFTGKIKCGHCGQSFMRNTRRRRLKGVPVEQCDKYTTYGCGTQKKKGGSCPARDIPEETLKAKCAEVLGLDEFDAEIFSAQVEKIIVPEHLVLEFHMADGRVIRTEWVSTAKKDAWTAERRAAKGKLVQERQITSNSSCFTSRIRCELCGENYRRQRSKRVDSTFVNVWRCASSARCKSQSLPEPTLHELTATALGLEEFSEDAFTLRRKTSGLWTPRANCSSPSCQALPRKKAEASPRTEPGVRESVLQTARSQFHSTDSWAMTVVPMATWWLILKRQSRCAASTVCSCKGCHPTALLPN